MMKAAPGMEERDAADERRKREYPMGQLRQSEELGMRHRPTNHWSDDDSEETIDDNTSDEIWRARRGEPAEG